MAEDEKDKQPKAAGGAVESTVFPIPGRIVVGEPMEFSEEGDPKPMKVASKTEAERLVATGGFAHSLAEARAAAFSTPEGEAADEDVLKVKPDAQAEE